MLPFDERKAARIERMRQRAEKLRGEAASRAAAARSVSSHIPMGQPILVGHHSEKRHRRDLERIDTNYRKSFEASEKAGELERRATSAVRNLSVSSDDPNAVAALLVKLQENEAMRARMVAINKAVRSKDPRAALVKLGESEANIAKLLTPDFARRIGIPPYALTNAAAESSRLRKRIAALEAKAIEGPKASEHIGAVTIEESENRVRMRFPDKPDAETRSKLKRNGFHWSSSEVAWQRMASNGAWYQAREIAAAYAVAPIAASTPRRRVKVSNPKRLMRTRAGLEIRVVDRLPSKRTRFAAKYCSHCKGPHVPKSHGR